MRWYERVRHEHLQSKHSVANWLLAFAQSSRSSDRDEGFRMYGGDRPLTSDLRTENLEESFPPLPSLQSYNEG
jgi:hypothetical protein